jgi:hypothetical protein
MLDSVVSSPLPLGFRLADIPAHQRLNELEFMLPAGHLRPDHLKTLLDHHQEPIQLLMFEPLQGYLRGFIILVFQHQNRYFVLDWKSNHLGNQPDDYHPQRFARVMAKSHYDLQSLIYSLAFTVISARVFETTTRISTLAAQSISSFAVFEVIHPVCQGHPEASISTDPRWPCSKICSVYLLGVTSIDEPHTLASAV